MTQSLAAILIGGVLPALFFGISGALAKPSTQAGIGIGLYLLCLGIAVTAVGALFFFLVPDRTINLRSGFLAALVGITWAIAAGLVVLALSKYGVPIARLAPLYNMNTLVTVVIGLYIFAEWRDVNAWKLGLGTLFVVAGGMIVANS